MFIQKICFCQQLFIGIFLLLRLIYFHLGRSTMKFVFCILLVTYLFGLMLEHFCFEDALNIGDLWNVCIYALFFICSSI